MKKGANSENALNENALSGALISIDEIFRDGWSRNDQWRSTRKW